MRNGSARRGVALIGVILSNRDGQLRRLRYPPVADLTDVDRCGAGATKCELIGKHAQRRLIGNELERRGAPGDRHRVLLATLAERSIDWSERTPPLLHRCAAQ